MSEAVNYMDVYRTLTGMTLTEALRKMVEVLPPDAYKSVPGGADLTDISPAYLTEVATQVFGMCGVGWRINYDPDDLEVVVVERPKKNSDETRTVYVADLKYLYLQFAYVDAENAIRWSESIPANGGSENENPSFAVRGALTNAIGAAFSKLCWQLLVYKDKLNHRNAAAIYERMQKRAAKNKNGSKAAGNAETKMVSQQVDEMEMVETDDVPTSEPQTENQVHDLEWAKAQLVPEGIGMPLAGKTLGEASDDAVFGAAIIRFLSGKYPNASGNTFTPANKEQEDVLEAANLILPTLKLEKKKPAKKGS